MYSVRIQELSFQPKSSVCKDVILASKRGTSRRAGVFALKNESRKIRYFWVVRKFKVLVFCSSRFGLLPAAAWHDWLENEQLDFSTSLQYLNFLLSCFRARMSDADRSRCQLNLPCIGVNVGENVSPPLSPLPYFVPDSSRKPLHGASLSASPTVARCPVMRNIGNSHVPFEQKE